MGNTQNRIEDLAPGTMFWIQLMDDRFMSIAFDEEDIIRPGDLFQFRAGTEGLKHCSTVVYRTAGGPEIVRWCDVPDDPMCDPNPWIECVPRTAYGSAGASKDNILAVAVGRLTTRLPGLDDNQPDESERAATLDRWKHTIATPLVDTYAPPAPAQAEA
jgi:hypothetical protein